jgi:hypothetical protein
LRIQRREIVEFLQENPSLGSYLEEALEKAYRNGRDLAMGETDLPDRTFPIALPYPWENIIAEDFYPGEPSDLL